MGYRCFRTLNIPWTNYFDDYVAFASLHEQQSVTGVVHGLFKILGWKFAESGEKAPPFAPRVTALGVDLDVTDMHSGVVRVENTLSRKNDLVDTLENKMQSGHLPQHQAVRLRGRMQFSAGQIFGRLARKALSFNVGCTEALPGFPFDECSEASQNCTTVSMVRFYRRISRA